MSNLEDRIFVAGHRGMVGSAIVRQLRAKGYSNILTVTRSELNLLDQQQVREYIADSNIDQVYLAAAKVGGIHANNTSPAEFIYQNLLIQCNVIHAAHLSGVEKLLFLGSSCIYPREALQPITEDALLTGKLEQTNEPYAVAKIAGIKMCESYNRQYGRDYRSVMPTNLYGPGDNFHLEESHVLPALIRRIHDAKINKIDAVELWGTGTPKREFLHVDDMAKACEFVQGLDKHIYDEHTNTMLSHINVGSGLDITIKRLAEKVRDVVGYDGNIVFDSSRPDGAMRKLMDVTRLSELGWQASIPLSEGIRNTYHWFRKNANELRTT